ncbi:hypothetical protein [Nocardia sp. NPDC020380]|uniref:nSTAND1 domain-containing NTPase n=1 Tax=Nocardia sp. NPDC020380 TaxID=3364309 RepID=UPI0037ABD52D
MDRLPRQADSPGGEAGGPDSRAVFAARLTALFAAARDSTVKSVIRAANTRLRPGCTPITAQRISDWRRGNRTPAAFESVLPVLEVLIREVGSRPPDARLDAGLLDLKRWRADWQAARTSPEPAVNRGRAPYHGLGSCRQAEADLFFGREGALRRLWDLIIAAESGPDPALVVLCGARGLGKSSLLSAGLLGNPGAREPIRITPHDDLDAVLDAAPRGHRLLVVDRIERLFIKGTPEETQRFLERLTELAAPQAESDSAAPQAEPRTTVVISCDSAYLTELTRQPALAATLRRPTMLLEPMTEAELREAITRPAAAVGLKVEDSLVEVLLHDLAVFDPHSPIRLPMLSYVLSQTWAHRTGSTLTLEAYRECGGVDGAFAKGCELIWDRLNERDRVATRHVLVALTFIGPTAAQRDRISPDLLIQESEDPAATAAVIAWLTRAQFLVRRKDRIELVHDLMLTAWPRMTEWLSEEREFAALRPRIEADAREWSRQGRPPRLLYRRARLDDAMAWLRRTGTPNRLAREFLSDSMARHRRRLLRRRLVQVVIAVLVAIAVVLAVALFVARASTTEEQRGAAVSVRAIPGDQPSTPVARTGTSALALSSRP